MLEQKIELHQIQYSITKKKIANIQWLVNEMKSISFPFHHFISHIGKDALGIERF